ncbi:MAG: hypothetical protein ACPG77_17150, partial [Nannocystaceae bacterium]
MNKLVRDDSNYTHTFLVTLLFSMGCLAVVGCGPDSEATASESDGTGSSTESDTQMDTETGEPLGVTFWQEVAPIYFENCVSCHQDGGVAPFALDTFEAAQTWGPASAAATKARAMPPWLVRDDGSCGSFRDSRALV